MLSQQPILNLFFVKNMPGDILFGTIERYQGNKPWGRVLDAGTGLNSVKWLNSIDCQGWLGITADKRMKENVVKEAKLDSVQADSLVVGNWMDEAFCSGLGKFDTIVADYLFGAVDGFSPYNQDIILKKMRQHLNPGGVLYVIGMYPIPDHAEGDKEIICEIRRARDACILLGGHRPYREYPSEWVIRHLQQDGFEVKKSRSFSILHSKDSAVRQIRVARSKLELMESGAIRGGMQLYLDELESRVEDAMDEAENGNIPLSHDYVLMATLPEEGQGANLESVFEVA